MYYDPRINDHGLPHNPITALVLPRPIGWISTIGANGIVNLAPYSFFNLLSAKPPFLMFSSEPSKHSSQNAVFSGEFVFNLVTYDLRESMNLTASQVESDVSESELAKLEMVPSRAVAPPRVAASPVALECKYYTKVDLVPGGETCATATMIIGEVVGVHIDDRVIVDGIVDVMNLRPISRLGYMQYCTIDNTFEMEKPV